MAVFGYGRYYSFDGSHVGLLPVEKAMKNRSSGMVLSGIDRDQYTSSFGVPIESRVAVEPLDMKPHIGSGEVSPAMFGQSIVDKLPEPVQEFLTTPAPSSLAGMAVVTVGGAAASHLVGVYGDVSPQNRAILGAALVVGGHFIAKSWAAKSIGYGALAEGLAQIVADKIKARSVAAHAPGQQGAIVGGPGQQGAIVGGPGQQGAIVGGPGQQGAIVGGPGQQGAIVGGLRNEDPLGSGPVIEESLLLRQVEEGTVELPQDAPSGEVEVPSSEEAARDPRAMGLLFRDLTRRRHTKLDRSVVVQLIDGRRMSIGQYLQEFGSKVEGARQMGLMRRSRRARHDLPMQSEYQFIRSLINRCLARSVVDSSEEPEQGVRAPWARDSFLDGAPELDIALFDGTVRPASAYASEFPERIEWAKAYCLANSGGSPGGAPGASSQQREPGQHGGIVDGLRNSVPIGDGSSQGRTPPLIKIAGERVAPQSPTEIRPVTTISANAATVQAAATMASNVRTESLTVRPPPFRRQV
jgi:hypothetical protein